MMADTSRRGRSSRRGNSWRPDRYESQQRSTTDRQPQQVFHETTADAPPGFGTGPSSPSSSSNFSSQDARRMDPRSNPSGGRRRGRNSKSTNFPSQDARMSISTAENGSFSMEDNGNASYRIENTYTANYRMESNGNQGNRAAFHRTDAGTEEVRPYEDLERQGNSRRGGGEGGRRRQRNRRGAQPVSQELGEDGSTRSQQDGRDARKGRNDRHCCPSREVDGADNFIHDSQAIISNGTGGDVEASTSSGHSKAQMTSSGNGQGSPIHGQRDERLNSGSFHDHADGNKKNRRNRGGPRRSDFKEQHQRETRQQWRPTSQWSNNLSSPQAHQDGPQEIPVNDSTSEMHHALQGMSIGPADGEAKGVGAPNRQRNNPRPQNYVSEIYIRMQTSTQQNNLVIKDRSNIPQLVQELEDKLRRGKVECMICYDMVRREAAIWSCTGCYAIFHISCIRKWARAPISADFSLSSSDQSTVGNWRCPGCQSPKFVSPEELKYRCFCGQVQDPPVDFYLTPHSCGGPCKKPLSAAKIPHCKHICTMQCHPGPCPPCNALAPPQFCPCGKTSYTQRCSELKTAKTCGQVCGHQLQCGRHYCEKVCHEGPCGNCEVMLTVSCFCGRKKEAVQCGTMNLQGELDWKNGVFSCENTCPNKLDCGRHSCNKKCHPGQCGECELSPQRLQTCPCGKTRINQLLGTGKLRETCMDPVPLCGQVCHKLLPCGKHTCQSSCHMGECPPCTILVQEKCRCKSSSQTVQCSKASGLGDSTDELFLCNRKCEKKKSCGRHRCSNRCCPLANDGNVLPPGEDDPHLCSLPCGKKLRCGQHFCEELCHNGYCPPCLGSTFTELSCACGKTSIPPPVPCGTFPPSCPHPCSRPQPCGHAATHQCHFGECPPCIVLTAKECVGGHVVLRNVPCGSKDIKCNKLCGKTRQCRMHACARLCHLPPCDVSTSCDGTVSSCGQQCGAPRRDCQHVCAAICHPGSPCPETRCKFLVTIACSCGRLSHQVPCDAGGESSKASDSLELAYYSNLQLQPVDSKSRVPLGQRMLACDEECAKLEKKRILAEAFGVTPVDLSLSSETVQAASDVLKELLKRDPQWVLGVEDRFKYLVLGTKSLATGPIRVHVFCHLSKELREVIRQMAERWNLTVSAVGREPRRFLTVHVGSKTKVPPLRNLFGRSPLPLPGQAQAPAFNSSLDMDPRLVVGLFDLPREGDISTLVLRFGGECELVWLNDKNALAVFSDIMRAATAIRRVDHASTYTGAVRTSFPSGTSSRSQWGTVDSTFKGSRKKITQESSWSEDAWGDDCGRAQGKTVWDGRGPCITTSVNPWGALEQDEGVTKNSMLVLDKPSTSGANASCLNKPKEKLSLSDDAENWEDLDG